MPRQGAPESGGCPLTSKVAFPREALTADKMDFGWPHLETGDHRDRTRCVGCQGSEPHRVPSSHGPQVTNTLSPPPPVEASSVLSHVTWRFVVLIEGLHDCPAGPSETI